MQIHQLKRKTKNQTRNQVGRGGKRGKTSGRGHKGQKARAGHSIRPEIRDTIKRLPKLRGRGIHPNKSIQTDNFAVNINLLDKVFSDGDTVNPTILLEKNIIKRVGNSPVPVKILSVGETTKKLTIEGCACSAAAKEKIEKAGGKVA